jgi:Transposase and inactivated derivatives
MAKYNFEFKKKIVQSYINGDGRYLYLAKHYGIPGTKPIRGWVATYKKYGFDGLLRSRKKQTYTFDFKLHVVELYLTTEVSYQELALSVGIKDPASACKWVNDFRIAGPDALRPKRKGRRKKVDKPKSVAQNKDDDSSDTSEYIKQLEEDLLKLKIENAYLKELRRLRLEDEARLRERLESSTASEENSN